MIEQKLEQLAEYQAQMQLAEIDKQTLIDAVLTPEIKQKLADIDAEFSDKHDAVMENIANLTDEIKKEVVSHGATVKSAHLMAVYSKGRISWDTKILDGLAIVFPKLNEARKEGEPSVSIRKVG